MGWVKEVNAAVMESAAGKSTFNVVISGAARFCIIKANTSGSSELSSKSCCILLSTLDMKDSNSRLGRHQENMLACQENGQQWSQHLLRNYSLVCEKHSALRGNGWPLLRKGISCHCSKLAVNEFLLVNRNEPIGQRDNAES